jgi:hypothetical protein
VVYAGAVVSEGMYVQSRLVYAGAVVSDVAIARVGPYNKKIRFQSFPNLGGGG